jgi:predicted Zn-dependent protease with MMP-like domain
MTTDDHTDQPEWSLMRAPSLADIEALAIMALAGLPQVFREACHGVVFHVTDFPEDDVVAEMALESQFDILGLFAGAGLPSLGSGLESGQLPNTIHLYRRPILDYWAEHDETLSHLVAYVLIHEIGHHLGLSDEQLEGIEAQGD